MKINRKMYKSIKKMDRDEMDKFLMDLYKRGAKDSAAIDADVNYRMACIEAAKRTKGMGKKITDRFMMNLSEVIREGES